jgi:hypothetical protein
MTYEVRVSDASAPRELLDLWSANLPVRCDPDAKLRWYYHNNPHGPGQAYLLSHTGAPHAIGCAGIGPRTIFFRGEPLRAALFADLAVDRTHRSGFPALALLSAVKQFLIQRFDFGYGFPNDKAVAVYRRSGYEQLGNTRRYVRVLRTAPYVGRVLRSGIATRMVSAIVDRGLASYARARAYRSSLDHQLLVLPDFDDRFDRLWTEARIVSQTMCERTSAFLRWRFTHKPTDSAGHLIFALTSRETRALRAYAVVRRDDTVAEVADLFGPSDRDLDSLLDLLLPVLADAGFGSVSIRFLGQPRVPRLLAAHGFRRRDEKRAVMIYTEHAARYAGLCDEDSWYLTDIDEDT